MAAEYEIGVVGLAVMGRNLLLNIADHDFPVAGYNRSISKVQSLRAEAAGKKVGLTESLAELTGLLRQPRAVLLMVTAGPAVDTVVGDLLPHLSAGDLIIDAGNSHFKDTDRRERMLSERGFQFMGLGVSGGESGARYGPSMMPGGSKEAYERVRPILEAVAAKVNGDPCVTHLGPRSAGHFVKMVHNGIEYGIMQLIAETYDLMRKALGLSASEMAEIFEQWNQGELKSFLIEITPPILRYQDAKTGRPLVDLIVDAARQKGTGKWTSQEALELQVPIPTIDMAVMMRDLSGHEKERSVEQAIWQETVPTSFGDRKTLANELRRALYFGMIVAYAQGFALLRRASEAYGYGLNMEAVARIWRGGCIIRAALLEPIRSAFDARPDLLNLILDARLGHDLRERERDSRSVVRTAAQLAIPAPGFMASLAYYDAFRSPQLPANLIQAQRDYFGAHTYERVDEKGTFHTQWDAK